MSGYVLAANSPGRAHVCVCACARISPVNIGFAEDGFQAVVELEEGQVLRGRRRRQGRPLSVEQGQPSPPSPLPRLPGLSLLSADPCRRLREQTFKMGGPQLGTLAPLPWKWHIIMCSQFAYNFRGFLDLPNPFFSPLLAALVTGGSSQARDGLHTAAVTTGL